MYELDTKAARKADQTGSFISEIGKYVGVFKQAEAITASTGTKGVALTFECNGQKANISLYTMKSNGEKIMGFDALMAILTCLSIKRIDEVVGTVMRWDKDGKKEVSQSGMVFPELCNKQIGLLLETEDYTSNAGEAKTRMVLKAVFQAKTELTASEILDRKTTPEQLPRMVAGLRHRPVRANKQTAAHSHDNGAPPSQGFEGMDDLIPF